MAFKKFLLVHIYSVIQSEFNITRPYLLNKCKSKFLSAPGSFGIDL